MNPAVLGAIVGTAVLWAAAVSNTSTRNARLFVVLGLLTIGALVSAALRTQASAGVEVTAALAALAVVSWPTRFGLSSMDATDRRADVVLRAVLASLKGPAYHAEAPAFLPALEEAPFVNPDSPWSPAGRCYRVVLLRLIDSADARPGGEATRAFLRAGHHYWELAANRRVIGRRRKPSAWDEDMLVRSFLDEADRLIPPHVPPEAQDGAIELRSAESLVLDLERLTILSPVPAANRRLLVAAIGARIAFARDPSSSTAFSGMETTAAALNTGWESPAESE